MSDNKEVSQTPEERRDRARERASQWYWANRDRARESARQRRLADPEKARERQREQYRRTGAEYQRRRRQEDPEKFRAARHERYLKNREQDNEKSLRWARENPERHRALAREWGRRKKRADPAGESDRFRRMKMARLHGMKPDEWAALWDEQGGRCYLCGDDLASLTPRNVHVDHDHRCCPKETSCSYCRRGLACFRCNAAIGMAFDDPERLRRMAANLEVALSAASERLAAKPEQLTLDAAAS